MRLFVGNIPYRATEDDLIAWFKGAGVEATEATIQIDRMSHESRGFGFVELAEGQDDAAAIEKCNGGRFMKRPLIVDRARPKPERDSRKS